MAGIGFELKKLFAQKGLLNSVKAYGYATVICTGPMLFGFVLLLGITALCVLSGAPIQTREHLICMITYTLLASVVVTSFFSLAVTRFIADMLFEEKNEAVIPAFWGSSIFMMVLGSVIYGIFLAFSGATLTRALLCFVLFNELIIVWNAMNFLSAIKDYKGIFLSFFSAIGVSLLVGGLFMWLKMPTIESLLLAVSLGYGVMLIWDAILLHRYFPFGDFSAFEFMKWIDKCWPLALSGLLMCIGMYGHFVVMWCSDIGVQTGGLFFGAPWYDVPALLAFMTSIITTVNFVVAVEVNFYPKYRNHYSLYNDRGTIDNIKQSEKEMIGTLKTELMYTALKQLLFTTVVVALGGYLLDFLPLGFNEVMRGYFRTLCVAYGIYAIGNMLMLILLYFTDYMGALACTAVFAVSSVVLSIVSLHFPDVYYGFGFLLSALLFAIVSVVRLNYFTKRLPYYILAVQPLVGREHSGIFTKLGAFLEKTLGGVVKHEKQDQ
jgi:uncharacterized membrane protein